MIHETNNIHKTSKFWTFIVKCSRDRSFESKRHALEKVEKVNIISAIRSDQSAIMYDTYQCHKKTWLMDLLEPFGNLMQVYWKRRKIYEQDKQKN